MNTGLKGQPSYVLGPTTGDERGWLTNEGKFEPYDLREIFRMVAETTTQLMSAIHTVQGSLTAILDNRARERAEALRKPGPTLNLTTVSLARRVKQPGVFRMRPPSGNLHTERTGQDDNRKMSCR
jgi:hypothetical protein